MGIALPNFDRPLRISADPAMSREEFWRFAEENPNLRLELAANGEVTAMTPSFGGSSSRTAYLTRMLGNWADEDRRGTVLESNAGCELPDGSVLSPDAAWIASDRWTQPAIEDDAPVPCPDFVIELRSKSDRLGSLQKKMQVWIANGAQLAWLIDPYRKAVEIYGPGRPVEVQEGQTAVYGEAPVGGFILELGRIWA
jgi:Uma2 family endonuclease